MEDINKLLAVPIAIAVIVLLLLFTGWGAELYFLNEYSSNPIKKAERQKISDEGFEAGKGLKHTDCMNMGWERRDECWDSEIRCHKIAEIFTDSCLRQADVPDDVCADIPRDGDFFELDWLQRRCDEIENVGWHIGIVSQCQSFVSESLVHYCQAHHDER